MRREEEREEEGKKRKARGNDFPAPRRLLASRASARGQALGACGGTPPQRRSENKFNLSVLFAGFQRCRTRKAQYPDGYVTRLRRLVTSSASQPGSRLRHCSTYETRGTAIRTPRTCKKFMHDQVFGVPHKKGH